jgi:nucleoside-diphosphate-sugar epimerase
MARDLENGAKVLLLGGGYTLQRVASLLHKDRFVITSRNQDTCRTWEAKGWQTALVSLEDRDSIEDAFRRYPAIDTIVDSVPPMRDGDPIRGVRQMTRVLPSTRVRRIIYLSTTGVFGVRDGSEVTEATLPQPWNSQGEARWLSEREYFGYAEQHEGVAVTALRLPAIYGADRGIVHSIRSGYYRIIEDGLQWTNRIHVGDLARIIVACIQYKGILPPVLCVSDDTPARARDVAEFVCTREGLAYPRSISAQEAARNGAYTMLSNQRVRNDFMKTLLGLTLIYPSFREGLYAGDTEKSE